MGVVKIQFVANVPADRSVKEVSEVVEQALKSISATPLASQVEEVL